MSAREQGKLMYAGYAVNSVGEGRLRQLGKSLKRNSFVDLVLYPYGKYRQELLLRSTSRNDHHTHTAFYRSPGQMEALVGPVMERLRSGSASGKLKINVFAGSSGAEAFTMASVLMKMFPNLDFEIDCSDLHRDKIAEAESGRFTWMQITQGLPIPEQFMEETFDRVGEEYSVKPAIRERVTFSQADIVNDSLEDLYEKADIICAQNVFCHLDPEAAQKAFWNILKLARENAAIFIDGMDPDLRVTLTTEAGLQPLDFRCREIYEYARKHLSFNWWKYYYGREPYLFFKKDKPRRYGTIFFVEPPRLSRSQG